MKNQEQKTILLVEDDGVTAMAEEYLLKSFGYDVVPAKSGEEAVQIATGNDKIALILMDINLGPGMDGTEAARQILSKRNLPIVFLSSHTEKEYVERVKAITCYGYVMKDSGDFVLQSSIEMAFELFETVETLRESEGKHRAVVERANDGIVILQDGIVRFSNPSFAAMLGYETGKADGMDLSSFIPQENLGPILERYQKRMAGEKLPTMFETVLLHKSGKKISVEVSGGVIQYEGKPADMVVMHDTTERKQQEMILHERVKELNCLYAISTLSGRHNISLAEILKGVVELIPPAWQHSDITGTRIVLKDQKFQTANFQKTAWMQTHNIVVQGNLVGCVDVCYLEERPTSGKELFLEEERYLLNAIAERLSKIIERMWAEEALQKSEIKYKTLAKNIPQKIFLKDRNLVYVSCNENYARDLKIKSEEIVGKTDFDFFPEELAKKYRDDDKKIIESGKIIEFEEKYIQDGKEVVVQTVKTPVKDEQDNIVGILGIFRDITERKLAVMGRLMADVSHEINNPLAVVIGGTQLVLSRIDKKPSPFKSQLETVLRNAKRCKTILGNLLTYNRTIVENEETVNLPALIREAIEDVGYQYDMSGIETVLNCNEAANAEITGNSTALLSVFVNLIRNARQAMGEKGRLTITMQKEDEKHLRIEIHDTGSGMNAKQKAELFKPFASGWKERDGSGLGLATSLGIIETHGGSMSAESEGVGKGATFTILLPCEFKDKK